MLRRVALFVVAVAAVSTVTTVVILAGIFALALRHETTRPTATPARSYNIPAPSYQQPAPAPVAPLNDSSEQRRRDRERQNDEQRRARERQDDERRQQQYVDRQVCYATGGFYTGSSCRP